MARCSLLELNETRKESERESFLSKIFLDNLLLNRLFMLEIVTTIKVYTKIRTNSFTRNYTPCASRTRQGNGCHRDYYIMLRRNCTQSR